MAPKKTEKDEPVEPATPALRTYKEIHRALLEPIDKALISYRPPAANKPATIAYINVTDYKDLLDFRAGIWTSEIREVTTVGNSLATIVRISIHASDGVFHQDGSGIESLSKESYGDPFSNAYAQAFRRACEGHGLSRQLWRSNESQEMFEAEFHNNQADNTPTHTGEWSAEASNDARSEMTGRPLNPLPPNDAPPAPLVDFGNGAAKKNEAKLRDLCKQLNAAGVYHYNSKGEELKWNSESLDDYCQNGFDKAIAQVDDDEMTIMLTDLNDQLQERLSLQGDTTPVETASGMATEQQINALNKLCDIKKKNESKVAGEASGNRVGTFAALTEAEAAQAIKNVTKG